MKKILSVLIVVFFTVVLFACNKDSKTTTNDVTTTTQDEIDDEQPVIHGADEDITIKVGDEFDPLEGVTATDNKDGDITSKIEVSGIYDITTAGEYTIVYRVTDEAGNIAQVYRKLIVIFVPVPSDELIVNGDFSQGTNGWTKAENEGGAGTITEENGELKLVINAVGWSQPFPRIDSSPFAVEQGKTYEVTFEARAEIPRKMSSQVGELFDTAPWFEPYHQGRIIFELTTEMKEYSYKFTVFKKDNENIQLLFEFGTIDGEAVATTIYLDNVKVEESTPDPDTIPPIIKGVDDIQIEKGSVFDPLLGVSVEDNYDMDLTVDDIVVTGEVDTNTPDTYEITYTVKDASGNETVVKRKVTVVEMVFNKTDKIKNGDFSEALDEENPIWTMYLQDWDPIAQANYEIINEELVVDITSVGGEQFAIQIAQGGIYFEKGVTYKLVFKMKVDDARKVNVAIGKDLPAELGYWESFIGDNKSFDLTQDYKTYELIFTMENDTTDVGIVKFELGNIPNGNAATKVYIDDVEILVLDEEKIISNGDIENIGWEDYSIDESHTFVVENGMGKFTIINVGTDTWHNQLIYHNIKLVEGNTYKVVFKAKADDPRTILVKVEDPQAGYLISGEKVYDITNELVEYTFTFTAANTTDTAQLEFLLGIVPGEESVNIPTTLYFDDVELLMQVDEEQYENNQITNGTFDKVLDFSEYWGDEYNGFASGSVKNVDGVMVINLETTGSLSFVPQVYQDGLLIKTNRTYVVEFDIKADTARSINVNLGEGLDHDPWFVQFMDTEVVEVTTVWKRVKITFNMTLATNSNGKLVFELGQIEGTEGANNIYIDNIMIYSTFN